MIPSLYVSVLINVDKTADTSSSKEHERRRTEELGKENGLKRGSNKKGFYGTQPLHNRAAFVPLVKADSSSLP